MDIRIKEPMHLMVQGKEYIVRPGTVGVERNRVVFFYDNTRTFAAGFSRSFCVENPQMFQVSRTLTDREVSVKDVMKVLEESGLDERIVSALNERINSL